MAPPFDGRLAELDLEGLLAFLNGTFEEGLTWEAKGGDEVQAKHVRKNVAGFANAGGGSLILGAAPQDGEWSLPGVIFPGGEATTWLSNVVLELSPMPRIEVRVWPKTEGRIVALVAVEEIDEPPCMTGGAVWTRVSGQTIQVKDPAVLRSLFEKGDAARTRAEGIAQSVAGTIYARPAWVSPGYELVPGSEMQRVALGLGVAPIGWSTALTRRVFTAKFAASLEESVTRRRPADAINVTLDVSRTAVQATLRSYEVSWFARVYATGAAAVAYGSPRLSGHLAPRDAARCVKDAGTLACEVLTELGAAGDAQFAIHLQTTRIPPESAWVGPTPEIDIRWRASLATPDEAGLASVQRELEREAGYPVWEPEEGTDAP